MVWLPLLPCRALLAWAGLPQVSLPAGGPLGLAPWPVVPWSHSERAAPCGSCIGLPSRASYRGAAACCPVSAAHIGLPTRFGPFFSSHCFCLSPHGVGCCLGSSSRTPWVSSRAVALLRHHAVQPRAGEGTPRCFPHPSLLRS